MADVHLIVDSTDKYASIGMIQASSDTAGEYKLLIFHILLDMTLY